MEYVGLDFIGQVVLLGLVVVVAVVVVEFGPMLKARYVMSHHRDRGDDLVNDQVDEKGDVSGAKRNDESGESSIAMPKASGNENFPFPDAFTVLARLVSAGKLTEGEALRFGMGVNPGGSQKYKTARARLTMALDNLNPQRYPPLSDEQQATRQEMGLPLHD